MSGPEVKILQAGADDLDQVALLLARAFEDGDYADWLVPDPAERQRVYPLYFRMVLEPAIERGRVELTSDGAAAAVWYRLDDGPPPTPKRYRRRLAVIVGERADWFSALDSAFDRNHPRGVRHEYLAFLGVRPDRRGEGLGGVLLRHHHEAADDAGIICYLEATGERNAGLYARYGYRARRPFAVADGGPIVRPMMRPAVVSPP